MRWAEITVKVKPPGAEAVADLLIEEGSRGAATARPSEYFEGEVRVSGYLPVDDLLEGKLLTLKERVGKLKGYFDLDIGSLEITIRTVEETDWAEAWKSYYKPFAVGKVVIKPSWENYEVKADQIVVELDPGMAFGTGQHPTTKLCVEALQQQISGGEVVADIGTGSAILAITAVKLGASKVYAVDADPVAVEVANKNVQCNGLSDIITVELGDSLLVLPEAVDLVVMNILPNVIMDLASEASSALKSGGLMISSGIISERETDVKTKLESVGLETLEVSRDGSWVAILSRKPEGGA